MKPKNILSFFRGRFAGLGMFSLLWSGQTLSGLGSSMTSYALIIWAYSQQGSVLDVALLAVCSYLPSTVLGFFAGAISDRWNKKRVMLVTDTLAACASLFVLFALLSGDLALWHLYLVNLSISAMNAFQSPASMVAVTLITPKEQYTRVGSMTAFSNALTTLLTPAIATAVLAFAGIYAVIIIDLAAYLYAALTLLFLVKIPTLPLPAAQKSASLVQDIGQGLRWLQQHSALLRMILFFSFVNLLASLAGNSIMPAMVLARTGGNQTALGFVSASIGIGSLLGSVLSTLLPRPKNRVRVIFLSCALSFALCDILWGIGRTPAVWVLAGVAGNLPLPFLNANFTAIMREFVPKELQGRVFSTRDTLQFTTIPIGLLLGGVLADKVFEPLMATDFAAKPFLETLVGSGAGSGMALVFLLCGIVGCTASLLCLRTKGYRIFNQTPPFENAFESRREII